MFLPPLCARGGEMKRPVTNRDMPRWGEMNLQTNLLTSIAPQTWEEKSKGKEETENRGKCADSSNVFAVRLSKHA